MSVLVVSGTGTGVGKTVVTAAIATLAMSAGSRVVVVKPAQTGVGPGEPGDIDDVRRLSGCPNVHELSRFPDPLAPATAARRAGIPALPIQDVAERVRTLAVIADLVLVEGAGGLLVRLDEEGSTIADLAVATGAEVVVVTAAGLGTLNHTALTCEALSHRGLPLAGVVIGAWPSHPDLAARCNLADLTLVTGIPLVGALPEDSGGLPPDQFLPVARAGLAPSLGGSFDPARHEDRWRP